jgi:hydroxyacylglutathione hydrolase
MELIALPAFADNYIWMVHDGQAAWVVDPGEAAPVQQALDSMGLDLAGILVTHHHGDHVGGIDALRPRLNGRVVGPAREDIPQPFDPLREGDHVDVLGARFEVIEVPGHTAGHIAFFHDASRDSGTPPFGRPVLFCGDTLFSGGCGRLFEGSPAQMQQSLARLANLPGETAVCCAHEYTVSNLRFALAVEPRNPDLLAYDAECRGRRARGLPTLPSRIDLERAVNPFLRCHERAVAARARDRDPTATDAVQVFRVLREWKNEFR